MKKFFATLTACLVMVLAAQAEAEEIYVGTSPTTGRDCYVITESIRWQNRRVVNLSLAMYRQGEDNPLYLAYEFREHAQGRGVEFSNRQGYRGWIDKYETPIEYNAWVCAQNNYNPYNRR